MKAVILSAGQSSRFWPLSSRHKSLLKIMGRPLIWYTLDSLRKVGIKDVVVVQGSKRDVEAELKLYKLPVGIRLHYIVQREAKGMGNALWQARNLLKTKFLVLNAERVDADELISEAKKQNHTDLYSSVFLLCQKTASPELYGILKLKGKKVLSIVEKPQKGQEPSHMRVLGVYFLDPEFFNVYSKVKKGIYDFELALSRYAKQHEVLALSIKKRGEDTPTLKYPWHLFGLQKYLFFKRLKSYVAKSAQVAKSTTITDNVYIGENTKIFEGAKIKGPCYIGNNCKIGNNSLIREYSNLEDNVLIGANAEVKNSIFQENCHTHSGFFGNSIFGKDCTIGAGAITANRRFDRKTIKAEIRGKTIDTDLDFLGTIVGQNSKIGINVSLMPGVLIGSNCLIGPHSLVKENISDDSLFYSQFQKFITKRKS